MDSAQVKERSIAALKDALVWARGAKLTALGLVLGVLVLGRIALLQLGMLGHPLSLHEGHHWRQAFSYGVAWNYAHLTKDFFHPRMFAELAKSNIVAMEAPIYPYLCAPFLRIFGDAVWPMRLVSWLSLVAIIAVLFEWFGEDRASTKDTWADRAGLFVAFGVCPSVACEFRSAQPDPMTAGLAMLAALFLTRYARRDRPRDLAIGGVLACLAVLTKPVALGILPALVVFGTYGQGRWLRRGFFVVLAITAAAVPHFLWDHYAQGILKNEMNGVIVISIQHDPKEMLRNVKSVAFLREALLHFLPNYAGSWWLVPALFAGIYRSVAEPRLRRLGLAMLVWLGCYVVELLAFGDRLHSNAYYFVLAPAAVLMFAALGIGALVRALDNPDGRPTLTTMRAALITLLLPVGVYLSNPIDWKSIEFNALSLEKNRTVWTSDYGLVFLLLGVLLAFGLAPVLRPRRIPVWAAGIVFTAVFCTTYWASQDAVQYLRYYDGSKNRATLPAELAGIHAAIDRHSKPADRVVVDPSEMTNFYMARRNGFTAADAKQLDRIRDRGARLWLQLEGGGAPSQGRLLETGQGFKVYCIAADDCP